MTPTRTGLALGAALVTLLLSAPAVAQEGPPAALERTEVPAAGSSRVVLDVNRFGRYALTASSDQGVALELVDRMAGPGEAAGVAGERDGRLDLILDRSQYLVVTHGHERATGSARLDVRPFEELHRDPVPELVELKLVTATLGDLEQRSYWLKVPTWRWVAVEAAGRHLNDLRLWRDGTWLVEAEPEAEVIEPEVGSPQLALRLAARLEPGTYLLTAYGGEGQPWASGGTGQPFSLRWGIPTVGAAGRRRLEVGPFGYDRVLVPRQATLYRLELAEALPAALEVTPWDDEAPFAGPEQRGEITKRSREPVAELETAWQESGLNLVTVRGVAGQPYLLQHFDYRPAYRFSHSGTYWLSTVATGHPADAVDVTAVLVEWRQGTLVREPRAEQVVALDREHGYSRRCNLLDTLELFVRVGEAGAYRVDLDGVEARYRFEPFLVYRPRNYQEPRLREGGSTWDLDPGIYTLTLVPEEYGIVTVTVRHAEGPEPGPQPPQATADLGPIQLSSGSSYELYLNRRPGVKTGLVLRPWSDTLATPLPLTLRPGEEVELGWRPRGDGEVVAVAEDGAPLELRLDGGGWVPSGRAAAPAQALAVRNPGSAVAPAAVAFVPRPLLDDTPLPPLPATDLPDPPNLPVLAPGSPLHLDLAAGRTATFAVEAPAAGLYRLETTGLLDTAGTLRTRTVTSLASASDGGTGRNFLLHRVLREGSYQLTVATEGSSSGHLGVTLSRTEPADGGLLEPGVPARAELAAGETVAYRFRLDAAADFRLLGLARDRVVRCRLEDADGWPVVAPDLPADMVRRLEPGEYRFVLLPEPVSGRRLTLLERLPEPLRFAGNGPHPLPLATEVEHRWLEPAETGERTPDRWRFDLPAAAAVSVRLSGEVEGELLRLDPDPAPAGAVLARKGFTAPLPAGRYQLEVLPVRRDNDVPYRLEVAPEELVDGLSRRLVAPAEVAVAVAPGRQLELETFGPADVRATLLDPDGRVVAAGDDRAGDWNVNLALRADSGRYRLVVEPVGSDSAATEVRMAVRPEVEEPPLPLPAELDLVAGSAVHTWPLQLGVGTDLLLVTLRSTEEHGLAVDWRSADGPWTTLAATAGATARLELPLPAAGDARLRAWSGERRGGAARLAVTATAAPRLDGARLARGAQLPPLPGPVPAAAAVVELERPGVLRLEAGDTAVRWSAAPGEALQPVGDGPLVATGRQAVLAADRSARVRLERLTLAPGPDRPLQLALPAARRATVDLATDGDGPLLVTATALLGEPLLALTEGDAEPTTAATAVAPGRALAVALRPRAAAVCAWWGDRSPRAADLRLEAVALPDPERSTAAPGRLERALEPGRALALRLPDGPNRLRLGLGAGVVAVLADRDRVDSVHWAAAAERVEELTTSAPTLLLLNPGATPAPLTVDLLPASGPAPTLTPGSPLETVVPVAGTLRLAVEPGDRPATLRLGDAATSATFVGARGPVARGREITVPGPGVLLVDHGPGLVAAWLEQDPLGDSWTGSAAGRATPVDLPTRRDLDGEHARFALTLPTDTLLELRSTAAAAVRLSGGGVERRWLDPAGGAHLALLPPGPAEVALRGLAGAPLAGELELTATEVTTVGEGLGPELLLPPGSGRAFRFTLPPGPATAIGVGVRSDSPHADCVLLDADGRSLGDGVAQLHELAPGDYLLLVRLPATAAPARVRPAVVGLDRPPTGPPDDVIRAYLEEAHP